MSKTKFEPCRNTPMLRSWYGRPSIGSESHSFNPDSAKFQQVHRYYERANGNTFLHNVLLMIIKHGRTVKSRVLLMRKSWTKRRNPRSRNRRTRRTRKGKRKVQNDMFAGTMLQMILGIRTDR